MTLYAIMKDGKFLRDEEHYKPICIDTWTDNPLKVRLYREKRYALAELSRRSLEPGVTIVTMELGPPVQIACDDYKAEAAERQRRKAEKRAASVLEWRRRRAEEQRKAADEELERLRQHANGMA